MPLLGETTRTSKPFLERYFEAHTTGAAEYAGKLALSAEVGLERRFDVEIASGFSEALNGKVASEYSFDVRDGSVIADDGEPLENMMQRSRRVAYEIASLDADMDFVPLRFEAELDELYLQQSIIRGDETGNTVVTRSPMTMELAHRPDLLKKGFQRPDLRRSMLRVSHWDGQKMHVLTRSLDHSSLELLDVTTSEVLGHKFEGSSSLEMLNEHILRNMTLEQVHELLNSFCDAYDRNLYAETGKFSSQGAYAPENIDLLRFVEAHPDILANVKKEVSEFSPDCRTYREFETRLNSCLYRHLALYEELLHDGVYDTFAIGDSASGAGIRAAESGTTYSLCGYLVGSDLKSELGFQTGFESLGIVDRQAVVDKLNADKRKGYCLTCGASGLVYGCGLCGRCNKVWCDEYIGNGRGLEIDEIAKRVGVKDRAQKIAVKAENKAIKKTRKVLRGTGVKNQRWEFFRRKN